MKKPVYLMPLLFMLGCSPNYMIVSDNCPAISSIKSSNDMATLVITRNGPIMFDIENYLDENVIGYTIGKSYFITQVPPGSHFVTAKRDDNYDTALLNFEANKTYYLINNLRASSIDGPRVKLDKIDEVEAKSIFADGCKFYTLTKLEQKLDKNDFTAIKDNYYETADFKSKFPTTSLVPLDRIKIITRISSDKNERLTVENIALDKFTAKYNKLLISDIVIDNSKLTNIDNEDKENVIKLMPEFTSLITNGVAEYVNDKKVIKLIKNSKPAESDNALQLDLEIDKVNYGNRVVKFATWLIIGIGVSTGDAQTYIRVKGRFLDYKTKQIVATFEEQESGMAGSGDWANNAIVHLPDIAQNIGLNIGKFLERNSDEK